jgi:predicted nucleic acid-binding protein
MTDKILIDTNILLHAYMHEDRVKQHRAQAVLETLMAEGSGVVSAQVLGEFFVTVTSTRKFKHPLSLMQARDQMNAFLENWRLVDVTTNIVLEAIRGVQEHSMNYWDAQLWASARLNQINTIYSENGPTGAIVEGVHYVNPLRGPKLALIKETPKSKYTPRQPSHSRR